MTEKDKERKDSGEIAFMTVPVKVRDIDRLGEVAKKQRRSPVEVLLGIVTKGLRSENHDQRKR